MSRPPLAVATSSAATGPLTESSAPGGSHAGPRSPTSPTQSETFSITEGSSFAPLSFGDPGPRGVDEYVPLDGDEAMLGSPRVGSETSFHVSSPTTYDRPLAVPYGRSAATEIDSGDLAAGPGASREELTSPRSSDKSKGKQRQTTEEEIQEEEEDADDEQEERRIAENLAKWAQADKKKRQSERRTSLMLPPTPSLPSASTLSRTGSAIFRRTSLRGGLSRQGSQANGGTSESGLKMERRRAQKGATRLGSLDDATIAEDVAAEEQQQNPFASPTSTKGSTISSGSYGPDSPVVAPSARQDKTSSRFIEDLPSQVYSRSSQVLGNTSRTSLDDLVRSSASRGGSADEGNPFQDVVQRLPPGARPTILPRSETGQSFTSIASDSTLTLQPPNPFGTMGVADDPATRVRTSESGKGLLRQDTRDDPHSQSVGQQPPPRIEISTYSSSARSAADALSSPDPARPPMDAAARARRRASKRRSWYPELSTNPAIESSDEESDVEAEEVEKRSRNRGHVGWGEWLFCGCFGTAEGEEGQQGRTNPME